MLPIQRGDVQILFRLSLRNETDVVHRYVGNTADGADCYVNGYIITDSRFDALV